MIIEATSPANGPHNDERLLQILRAAMDRIIPPDDFPAAWDAGVGEYTRRQLAGDLHHLAPLICAGLEALAAEAEAHVALPFAALAPGDQDLLLERVAAGDVRAHWPVEPAAFFDLLVRLTNEGYYADPGNGGNRGEVAWRMIGYETRVPEGQMP